MIKPKFKHKIALIKINNIKPNKYNPNVMEDKVFIQTKKNIEREGLIGGIIVREMEKEKGKYIIIDGEHRWKASKELGYTEIPTIILDKKLPDAMIATINFNKLRGELDTLKLAEVIHDLNKTYNMEELEDKLGYTQDELKGLENLLKFDFDQFDEDPVELDEAETGEYRFEVILNQEQYKTIESALEIADKDDNAEGITIICKEYLGKYGKKVTN